MDCLNNQVDGRIVGSDNGSTCNQAATCSFNVAAGLIVPDKDEETQKVSILPKHKRVVRHGMRYRKRS